MKKDYKVELLIISPKLTLDSKQFLESSKIGIQENLDEYAAKGYSLHHSTSINFGMSVYIYLYFEKDI